MLRATFVCALLLAPEVLADNKATQIEPQKAYTGPQRLMSADHGLQFRLPKGWSGKLDGSGEYFVMSASESRYVFAGAEAMTLQQAKKSMAQPIPVQAGVTLSPKDKLNRKGRRLWGEFTVQGMPGDNVAFVETRVGRHGYAVYFVGLALGQAPPTKAVRAMAASVRFVKPNKKPAKTGAKASSDKGNWKQKLSAKKITRFYTGSGYSEKESLWLCKNGRFYRHFGAGGFTPGVASGAVQSKDKGRWAIKGSTLALTYDDSSTATYNLSKGKKGILLNGKRWYREATDCK